MSNKTYSSHSYLMIRGLTLLVHSHSITGTADFLSLQLKSFSPAKLPNHCYSCYTATLTLPISVYKVQIQKVLY